MRSSARNHLTPVLTMVSTNVSVHIDPARIIDEVDPRIYSGFTEHMGRCIYGGLYEPDNKNGLSDPKTGFRKDVLDVLRELDIPLVRYPGGCVDVVASKVFFLPIRSTLI